MPDQQHQADERFTILCRRCDRPLLARRAWAGREVECPHCASVLRVPAAPAAPAVLRAAGPSARLRRRFNFPCARCGCLLEADTGRCGQPAQCPTCAARFTVPYLDPRTGIPDRPLLLQQTAPEPLPLHAYAASGAQAPRIIRRDDGTQVIQCPRCHAQCPIEAASCPDCGTPFTLEAAPTVRSLRRDSQATASCTLGIVSLPTFFLFLPALLAIAFGLLSLRCGLGGGHTPRRAVVGIGLGLLSLALGALLWVL